MGGVYITAEALADCSGVPINDILKQYYAPYIASQLDEYRYRLIDLTNRDRKYRRRDRV